MPPSRAQFLLFHEKIELEVKQFYSITEEFNLEKPVSKHIKTPTCQSNIKSTRTHMASMRSKIIFCALSLSLATVAFANAPEGQGQAFDLETMPVYALVVPVAIDTGRRAFGEGANDVTLIVTMVAYINLGLFDALAPYHPTATGKAMISVLLGNRCPHRVLASKLKSF